MLIDRLVGLCASAVCVSSGLSTSWEKCFNVAEICCFCMFFTSVVIILATFFESVPKLRSPISVLFLFVKIVCDWCQIHINPSSFIPFPVSSPSARSSCYCKFFQLPVQMDILSSSSWDLMRLLKPVHLPHPLP